MANSSIVFRLNEKRNNRFFGDWDGQQYNYDWQDRNQLVTFAIDNFGPTWENDAEIQEWEITEKRIK